MTSESNAILNNLKNQLIANKSSNSSSNLTLEELDKVVTKQEQEIEFFDFENGNKKPLIYEYLFSPQKDITVHELARLLAFTKLSVSTDIYENLGLDLKKHFIKYSE